MKKYVSKVVALVLCMVMVLGLVPTSAFAAFDYDKETDDYYNVISKNDYEIAPGITESEIVLNNDDGSRRQVLHFMEADISNPYTKVISSYTEMNTEKYQVSDMMVQATWIEENWGYNVVGAMNTCLSWYNTDYYLKEHPELINEPLGFMMVDGVIMNDEAVGFPTVLSINYDEKDGEKRPDDIPKVEMKTVKTIEDLNGWEEQIIPCSSGFVLKDGVVQSAESHSGNDAPRSVVGIKEDGTVVIMMNDGRQSPYSAGMTMYEIATAMKAAGCIHAVNCDGGGSSTFLSQRPGEELAVNCSPSDGALRSTTQGIVFISTAPATGEFVRANISSDSEYYTPESVVTFNALGTDLVGTEAAIPEDVSWQIKEEGMGTIEDGVFTSNGTTGIVTAQMVYNGEVVGEDTIEIVIPETLTFAQSVMTVPFGKAVSISLTATIHDGIHEVALKPSDIIFSTTNEGLGVIDGFTFKAVSEADAPEDVTSVLTATLKHNEELVAEAQLNLGKGSEVIEDFEDGIDGWSVGCVNSGEKNYDITAATVSDGQTHDGNRSMRFEINGLNFNNNAGSYKQVAIYPEEDIIIENAKSIGAWIYVPDEFYNLWIRFHYYYESADGTYTKKNTVPVFNQPRVYNEVNESGWYYFSVDVSAYESVMLKGGTSADAKASRFIEFNACHMATNDLWTNINGTLNGDYTIYVDSICADFSDAVDDREAPIFESVSLVGNESDVALENHTITSTSSNNLTINAKVSENTTKSNATGLNPASAKAYVDGKQVECAYNNGKIAISDVKVADGAHRVKFEICDMTGNKSVVVRVINVQSGVDASTIQVVPADATLDKVLGGSVYWMNLNATDIETIQSVSTVIDLNSSNHWELDHMEVAEGFTAEYTIAEETNTATITVTRTGKNTQTGEATLASLPIRVIYYDTDINIEGYTAETYWKDYNFWSHDLKVDVDKGVITYVDGYTSDVLNVFSNGEFSVDTEWYTSGLKTDATYKAEKGTCHVHTEVALDDKAATCTEDGYTGRTFCEECNSVVDWGTIEKALGHDYQVSEGILSCTHCEDKYNGELDGKTYINGVIADGWVDDTYYYIDGVKTTGSKFIDGKMYTFDDAGVYLPDYKYDGFYEINDTVMYFVGNEYVTGNQRLVGQYYNFDKNGLAYDGEVIIDGITCLFEDGISVANGNVKLAGICGEDVHFVVYTDGRMTITGNGPMTDFKSVGSNPWYEYQYRAYIETVYISKGVTSVGKCAFHNSPRIKEVLFEEGSQLKSINTYAFSVCTKLESITLPEGLETIQDSAFYNSTALKWVYMPASLTTIGGYAFGEITKNITMNVLEGSVAHGYAKYQSINCELRLGVVDSGTCGANVEWTLYSDGSLIISGDGAMTDYTYHKYGETAAPWAVHRSDIKKVVIESGVTSVGNFAFYNCTNLTSVEFVADSAVKTIGIGAFGYTGLISVTLPATVETIYENAFYYCGSLEEVVFEEESRLFAIGELAFRNCTSLKKVYIPDSINKMGAAVFYACGSQLVLDVADGLYAHDYAKQNGYTVVTHEPTPVILYSGNCGESVTWTLYNNGDMVISGNGAMTDYTYHKYGETAAPWTIYRSDIKKVIIESGVTSVGNFAFYNCTNLTSVEFVADSKVKTIGIGAFGYTGLASVILPATVETICENAFYYNGSLEEVAFEEESRLFVIGELAFRNCTSLKEVYIPDSVSKMGAAVFYACGSQLVLDVANGLYAHEYAKQNGYAVVIHDPAPVILYSGNCGNNVIWSLYNNGDMVISGNGAMTDYTYHKYGETAAPWTIYRKDIKKVVIESGVTSVGNFAFYNCTNLTSLEFTANCTVKTIGVGAFGYTGFTSVTLPASLETINENAFYYCGSLEEVAFEADSVLRTIGDYAFRNCTSLKKVCIPDTVTRIGEVILYACGEEATLYVANGSYAYTYATAKKYNVVTY